LWSMVVSLAFLSLTSCVMVCWCLLLTQILTGHNRLMTYSDVAIAVARGFERPRNVA
jgi:hypothetical protein